MLTKLASAFLLAALPLVARADPLATANLPLDTRWVMHLNVDAARGTPLWELVRTRFVAPQKAAIEDRLRMVEGITGVRVSQDLHDITLYGTAYDDASVCLLIHAPFNQERLVAFLKQNREFTTLDHNGHTIISWRDKDQDRLMYGAFMQGDVAAVSPSVKMLGIALDTIDGKSPSLVPTSPLAPVAIKSADALGTLPVVWIAGTSISELPRLQKVESPFLQQVDNAAVRIVVADDRLAARLTMTAKSDKAAHEFAAIGEGVKALVAMYSADEHVPLRAKLLSTALEGLTFTTDGRSIAADWSVGVDKIESLVEMMRGPGSVGAPGDAAAIAPADAPAKNP